MTAQAGMAPLASLRPTNSPFVKVATGEVGRFLLAGGGAAALNWLARMALSTVLPLDAAILLAYGIGMVAGFVLYRRFVFEGNAGPLARQVGLFVLVNAIGAVVVLAVTMTGLDMMHAVAPQVGAGLTEALAHGAGIGVGAIANFLGHRGLTFAARR